MRPTETIDIVARLSIAGLLPAREGQAAIWHEDIGHLDYATAKDACRWLRHHRNSDAYGPVKPADFLDAVTQVRRERVVAALGGPEVSLPAPPPEIDPDDVTRWIGWQKAWVQAAGDGATFEQATAHADHALDVVRAPQPLEQRPVAALVASVAQARRAPGTRSGS